MKPCPEIVTYRAESGRAPADFIAFYVAHVDDPKTGGRVMEFATIYNAPIFYGFSNAEARSAARRWWENDQLRIYNATTRLSAKSG